MGANNSQIHDRSSDPRVFIQRGDASTRLEYHGVCFQEGKPSAPDGVPFVKNISHNCLTLSWQAPRGFPAKSILAYQIEVYNVFEHRWKVVTNSCQGTSYDVKNLAPDTEYRFRVRAENLYGRSRPGHVSPVVRTRDISESSQQTDKTFPKPQKIVRRHSHHIKVDGGVATLLKRTEESKFENHVGTIPFKRNSSLRGSLPVQRRSVSAVFPASKRDSLNSFRESRRSLEESSIVTGDSSVATGDDESASGSLRLKRFSNMSTSTTTEEESCNQSTSASSMTSIPEEADVMDNYTIPEEDDFLTCQLNVDDWKLTGPWTLSDNNTVNADNSQWNSSPAGKINSQQWQSANNDNQWKPQEEDPWNLGLDRWGSPGGGNSHSQDIMSAPYSDDTKIAWCSPPSTDRVQKSYICQEETPVWKGQNNNQNNRNLSSFRGMYNDDDIVIKNLSSDSNGNYSFDPKDRQCCIIEEDDEAMDLVSAV
ncbi:LOW QUALITY PROTEIN: twitchin-like [Pecten maximus]|uniref:LOW QUALITY PROTEIN: twitchin-like n=1 Tax=Pecten maximus TaxID=6579 RepID=UPI001458D3BA|nr:LOW QUALITY PROTEIN: twitchin-like [Pecten maximus]